MRSRYSAYVLGLIDYLLDTTLPVQKSSLDRESISQWSARARVRHVHGALARCNRRTPPS
jgi:uncharacterized protein YchJ